MDTQSSGADITGATLGRRATALAADEPIATPRADALLALAERLDTENSGLDGLSRAIASLRHAGQLTSRNAYAEAAAVRRLEQDLAKLRRDYREMHADRDGQLDIITERNAALNAETAKVRLLTVERDSLLARVATQAEALAAHERANAELRAEIAHQVKDVDAYIKVAAANAELHSKADAARAAAVVRAELAEAELAAIAQRRRRQRDGKRRKRPATKQAA